MSTYPHAKAQQKALYSALDRANSALQAFPKGAMGLTPDSVKASAEFKQANARYQAAFQAVRSFNAWFTKQYKKERQAERKHLTS